MLLSPRPEPTGPVQPKHGARPVPPLPGVPVAFFALPCIDEVPEPLGLSLYRYAGDVATWTAANPEERGTLFGSEEAESASQSPPAEILPALAALDSVRRTPAFAGAAETAQACAALSAWAKTAEHAETSVLFAELAAHAEPMNAARAVAAGRALRDTGKYNQARRWFDRAERLAHNLGDNHTRADALLALGLTEERQGRLAKAMRLCRRSYRLAHKYGFNDIGGFARINALAICGLTRRFAEALSHAEAALTLLGADHERIPPLAQDIAHLWTLQGYYDVALPVLQAALPVMTDRDQRYITIANLARAAAGVGDRELFVNLWDQLQKIEPTGGGPFTPDALIGLAEGALMLDMRVAARDLAAKALEIATVRRELLTASEAADLLARVPQGTPRLPRATPTGRERLLAGRLVRVLKEAAPR